MQCSLLSCQINHLDCMKIESKRRITPQSMRIDPSVSSITIISSSTPALSLAFFADGDSSTKASSAVLFAPETTLAVPLAVPLVAPFVAWPFVGGTGTGFFLLGMGDVESSPSFSGRMSKLVITFSSGPDLHHVH